MARFLSNLGATLKSTAKIILQSRPSGMNRRRAAAGKLFVLGNGPSLRGVLDNFTPQLSAVDTLGVNFALNTPEIRSIRPRHYVLADPHFFRAVSDANVQRLWDNLRAVDWTMTLWVPAPVLPEARKMLDGSHVALRGFNAVGVEGFRPFRHFAYGIGAGMPRPRNVLIPAIMVGIAAGYNEIVLLGADHSWMSTLAVSDDNEVVSIQPHFYKEDEGEARRVRHDYRGYRLHEIVDSFAVAFRAYHLIAPYAASRGISILNATPGSFIDAFDRAEIEDLLNPKA